jgi:hypothetical protein
MGRSPIGTSFDDFIEEVWQEACEEGPVAVAETAFAELRARFAAQLLALRVARKLSLDFARRSFGRVGWCFAVSSQFPHTRRAACRHSIRVGGRPSTDVCRRRRDFSAPPDRQKRLSAHIAITMRNPDLAVQWGRAIEHKDPF